MPEQDIGNRVTRLEVEMETVTKRLAGIDSRLGETATAADLVELRAFFTERDQTYNKNLWKLVFGLVGLVALVAAVSFGLKAADVAGLFGGAA